MIITMSKDKRAELREQYKSRTITGGVFRIVNRKNGRFALQSTDDLGGSHNRLKFAKMTNSSLMPPMNADWAEYGPDAFEMEELDTLEKKPEQTLKEFQADLTVLLELWDEKLPKEGRY